jgi:hypothetical protein
MAANLVARAANAKASAATTSFRHAHFAVATTLYA